MKGVDAVGTVLLMAGAALAGSLAGFAAGYDRGAADAVDAPRPAVVRDAEFSKETVAFCARYGGRLASRGGEPHCVVTRDPEPILPVLRSLPDSRP